MTEEKKLSLKRKASRKREVKPIIIDNNPLSIACAMEDFYYISEVRQKSKKSEVRENEVSEMQ